MAFHRVILAKNGVEVVSLESRICQAFVMSPVLLTPYLLKHRDELLNLSLMRIVTAQGAYDGCEFIEIHCVHPFSTAQLCGQQRRCARKLDTGSGPIESTCVRFVQDGPGALDHVIGVRVEEPHEDLAE